MNRTDTKSLIVGAVFLLGLSLISSFGARAGDFDEPALAVSANSQDLTAPVLSARRLPHTVAGAVGDAEIEADIGEALSQFPDSSCLIVERDGIDLVAERNPQTPLLPASNLKLLTTWAALRVLGADHTFSTAVLSVEQDSATVSNLYLRGGGDPYLATDDWIAQYDNLDGRTFTSLEDLASQVAAAGIETVSGDLIVNESRYDSERVGPWAQRLIDQNQAGPLSALSVNEGFTTWGDELNLSSRVRSNDPAISGGQVFRELLLARGVTVEGSVERGDIPLEATVSASVESAPLAEIIKYINSYSSNFGAEMVVKELGLQASGLGSTDVGSQVVLDELQDAGIEIDSLVIEDGSGLAESNRITCQTIQATLEQASLELKDSLSVSGIRGSLEERFSTAETDGLIEAKTGTLRSATALSGFSASAVDESISITFSIIANDDLVSDRLVSLTTDLAVEFSRYPEAPGVEELGPSGLAK